MAAAREQFQFIIGAKDTSRVVLRRTLAGLQRFGRAGAKAATAPFKAMASMRTFAVSQNVQMLRSAAAAIDNVIEQGLRVGPVTQAFQSLTGRSAAGARKLARELQEASGGVLTMVRSMEIANRALTSGMSFDQLRVALEFTAKKAVVVGKEMGQALDTMITGLARGSTLFLDDYGILIDGLEGVKRTFDAIHGSRAFEMLGPAAQKAVVVQQAIAEMREQLGRLGITGREPYFVFRRIKTEIENAKLSIFAAIGASKDFRAVLNAVATTAREVAEAIQSEGLWAGLKKGAARVWQFLKNFFLDLAENVGAMFAYGAMKAIRGISDRMANFLKIPTVISFEAPGFTRTWKMLQGLNPEEGWGPSVENFFTRMANYARRARKGVGGLLDKPLQATSGRPVLLERMAQAALRAAAALRGVRAGAPKGGGIGGGLGAGGFAGGGTGLAMGSIQSAWQRLQMLQFQQEQREAEVYRSGYGSAAMRKIAEYRRARNLIERSRDEKLNRQVREAMLQEAVSLSGGLATDTGLGATDRRKAKAVFDAAQAAMSGLYMADVQGLAQAQAQARWQQRYAKMRGAAGAAGGALGEVMGEVGSAISEAVQSALGLDGDKTAESLQESAKASSEAADKLSSAAESLLSVARVISPAINVAAGLVSIGPSLGRKRP